MNGKMNGNMIFESAGYTYSGRREENEDSYSSDDDLALFVVADGMGGRRGGALASRLAVDAVSEVYDTAERDPGLTWPLGIDANLSFDEGIVELAIRQANRAVCEHKTAPVTNMGSTIAVIAMRDGKAVMAHVGDSRIYRFRGGELELLTEDHSLYSELKQSGATDLPPKSEFAYAHIITRALGRRDRAKPDIRSESLMPNDVFLLCSDGLTGVVPDEVIADILGSCPPSDAGPRLVHEAYRMGSSDNITAVVVRVAEKRHPQVTFDHSMSASAPSM